MVRFKQHFHLIRCGKIVECWQNPFKSFYKIPVFKNLKIIFYILLAKLTASYIRFALSNCSLFELLVANFGMYNTVHLFELKKYVFK